MKRIRIPLFGACILLPLAGIVFADYEEFAEARYQTASLWSETSELCGVANEWEPQIENRVGQEVVIETNKLISAGATVFCFDWTEPDGSAIDLRTYTCPDFSSAKTAMKRELGMMQSTVPMDTGTNGLEHLGDICLTRVSDFVRILFVRNNVFVSLRTDAGLTVSTNLLFCLDSQIVQSLVDIPDDPLRSSPSSFASESFQATRDSSSDSEEMSPSPPTIPVILGSQSAMAADPTPGQLFEAAFGVDPSRLGTTNFQADIRDFQTNCFATNEWVVSFADASERLDNTFVPFSLSNMVSGTVSAGFVEQSESPERAFWTAATRIAANSKPLFVLAEEWTANSDLSGISFLHTTGSSNSPDRLMRLERNLLVSVEASTLDNPSEIVFWIVSYLQNPLSSRADRGIVSGNSLREPFRSARGISSDSEEESVLPVLESESTADANAGGPNDTTGDYLDQFFAELPPLPSSNPTNSVVWSAPQLITMPDGQSFNVGQSAEDGNPIFESFQISSDNGITNGEFRIYRVPTSIHSYCIVESALSLPRSIPARAFASLFNAEAETNGVYCIVPKSALPGIPGFLLLYENMGIGLFWNGGNQKNLALALLRAGGVDIPDDPESPEPSPE